MSTIGAWAVAVGVQRTAALACSGMAPDLPGVCSALQASVQRISVMAVDLGGWKFRR